MGFDNNDGAESTDIVETNDTAKTPADAERHDEHGGCENYVEATHEEEQEVEYDGDKEIELGPKDDESLCTREEQLVGTVDSNSIEGTAEANVKILELIIKSPGMRDIVLPVPQSGNPEGDWFQLKPRTHYSLNFIFQVCNKPISGLKYYEVIYHNGYEAASATTVFGNFDPGYHTHDEMKLVTLAGVQWVGPYCCEAKFLDDNEKCFRALDFRFSLSWRWN